MEEYPDTYGKLDLEKIAADARYGGWLVFKGKGSTEFGIAASCVEIIKTIFSDEKKVCTVAVMLHGEFGQKDVYASVPAIIGRNGVEGIIELEMNDKELKLFAQSDLNCQPLFCSKIPNLLIMPLFFYVKRL